MRDMKPCPFCNELPSMHERFEDNNKVACINPDCDLWGEWLKVDDWNTRPIEDTLESENINQRLEIEELQSELERIKAENKWIAEKMGQQEVDMHQMKIRIVKNNDALALLDSLTEFYQWCLQAFARQPNDFSEKTKEKLKEFILSGGE